jgi:hypothetical protein
MIKLGDMDRTKQSIRGWRGGCRRTLRLIPIAVCVACSACYGRGFFPFAVAATAITTAAIITASEPPPPRVVYVPAPQPGYTWQPGYWTREGDAWVWVEGQWIAIQPGWVWSPTHWEQRPDGSWQLVQGRWVPGT